ncbi:hypothetical protein JQ608_15455 [Bradyrhizobium liaoningense]|uniref:hypothetical protein n=1 Tax=Bradyrhizobium TaxID=374 RepID=UPI001BA8C5F1|nr:MULTISPECIES: hypothetical protein [Bradyrhizobium]MBR0878557.1 hypothetical protein [Bradyrhizobium liaoningense]UQD98232.1 hypothetical protein JEY30_43575 [Bradyrhizobium japonicum]
MESSRRDELARIALQGLEVSPAAESGQRWGSAWEAEGAISFSYCPRSKYDDEEYWGSSPELDLPWTAERTEKLDSGAADPDESELRQWRDALCRRDAEIGEAFVAWLTPIRDEGGEIEAYALWLFSVGGAPEDPPTLEGIFDNVDDAKAELRSEGYLKE